MKLINLMKYLSYLRNSTLFNQLSFYSLLISSAFIILLWCPNAIGKHFSSKVKIVIYLFPWLMLWLAYYWQVVTDREHRLKIILMISIIILGIINIYFSNAPANSFKPMRVFLLTGIFPLWSSMFLFTEQRRRNWFDGLCCGALAVIASVEIITWLVQGNYGPKVWQVFVLHALPLGTLVILLSPGPMRLLVSKNFQAKLLGWLIILAGVILIFLTHKRATWLVLAAMLAMGMIYLLRRHRYLIITLLLIFALILSLQIRRQLARLDPKVPHYVSILHRLELYNFALHVWKAHPITGIGLRSFTLDQYLHDYQLHNKDLHNFPQAVTTIHTLDNMLLTALVELGSLMTLLYLGLILVIMIGFVRKLGATPESPTLEWFRLFVLLGFAINSLSYDSLLFPPVNWVFHVQLGLMASYHAAAKGLSCVTSRRQDAC
jgi:O-antigen ligase